MAKDERGVWSRLFACCDAARAGFGQDAAAVVITDHIGIANSQTWGSGSRCGLGRDHQDGPMIDRVKVLVESGYSLLVREVRRRVPERARVTALLASVFVVAVGLFIWRWLYGPAVVVTHDQARTYAGILAQVIPVLVLALYVESAAEWSTLRARRVAENDRLMKLAKDVYSSYSPLKTELEANRKSDEAGLRADPEVLSILEQAMSTNLDNAIVLQSLLLDHTKTAASQGVRTGTVALQLLVGLLGEVLALSCVLAPSDLIAAATIAVALLLFLFGVRLLEWPLAVGNGPGVKVLGFVGGSVLLWVYAASLAQTFRITVAG